MNGMEILVSAQPLKLSGIRQLTSVSALWVFMALNVRPAHFLENGTTLATPVSAQLPRLFGTIKPISANAPRDSSEKSVRPVPNQEPGILPNPNVSVVD